MTLKCKNCKYYIQYKDINNCDANIVGTVKPNDSSCYKIQFSYINENNK